MVLRPSLIATLIIALAATTPSVASGPATGVADFSLPTTNGDVVSLSQDPTINFYVICFLGTECPLARLYGPRLEQLSVAMAQRGIKFIGINSNVQDSMDELKLYVQQHGMTFPVAKDYDRQVAMSFGATRTPEVFVIDRAGEIRYQGRIDDQYEVGVTRAKAGRHDLRDALEQLVAGVPVTAPRTTAVGCRIALPRPTSTKPTVTFCDQVIRLLQKHCIECHREGEIGPFALDRYDEVVGWADMSLEVMQQGRMPPWHASDRHASLANARSMSPQDKELFRQWVESGSPYGDARQLPPDPDYVDGWRLPQTPDQVLVMSDDPFHVPAQGTVEYQYFVVDPGFTEDKWIRAAQVVPGNHSVVHHCIAFTRPPDGSDFRDIGMIAAYVPGQINHGYPEGYAQRVPAGSRIVLQMHYTPTGKPEQDLTKLGLVFAEPDEVTHEVFALGGVEQEFEIPPHAANHRVDGSLGWYPRDGVLLSIMPHMHLRGKSFQFQIESGGRRETLLEVPRYDFNWQHNYELSSPVPLADIDKLSFSAVFDNSQDNPFNPDPSEHVTWGDQTWQEMAVTFISVARPLGGKKLIAEDVTVTGKDDGQTADTDRPTRADQQRQAAREQQADAFAARYIARFDANDDGFVTSHELPPSVRLFAFRSFDHNQDSRISRDEIKAESLWRLSR